MAFTTPGTAVAGEVLTAAFWNEQVRDNMTAVAGPPFARNILYNGAMQIAQRGTSLAGITGTTYNTADRWALEINALGTWTQSVTADAPTGSGFRNCLKMLCTTADASPAAGDFLRVVQYLEGQDLQRIRKGTSSATPITISFWVKSNKTGTYVCELFDEDNTRQVSATYTISAADTWEYETITFPADTTGVFDNDNARSLVASFHLAEGSNFTSGTLNTVWAANTNANRAVGQTNLAANTNNYWQVTGVQLETGPIATPFEFLPFGDELARCQRYYEKSYNVDVAPGTNTGVGTNQVTTTSDGFSNFVVQVYFKTNKRANNGVLKTWTEAGVANNWVYLRSGVGNTNTAILGSGVGANGMWFYGNVGASWVPCIALGHWTVESEL